MTTIVEFPWKLGQRVKVRITAMEGVACGMHVDECGVVKAEVRYADGNNTKRVYFNVFELEEPLTRPGIGT